MECFKNYSSIQSVLSQTINVKNKSKVTGILNSEYRLELYYYFTYCCYEYDSHVGGEKRGKKKWKVKSGRRKTPTSTTSTRSM